MPAELTELEAKAAFLRQLNAMEQACADYLAAPPTQPPYLRKQDAPLLKLAGRILSLSAQFHRPQDGPTVLDRAKKAS